MALDRIKVTKDAEKYVRQGKIEQALQLYKQILDANPRDTSLKNQLGDLYVRAGRIQEAVQVFTSVAERYTEEGFYLKAIAIYKKINKTDPSLEDNYFRLAELYLKQGLKDDAKTQFQTVAELYAKAGNQSKMREALDRVVAIDPDNVKVRARLAEAYLRQNMKSEAVAEYRAVGEELVRKGMQEEAFKVYEKALSIEDGDPGVVASLCRLLLERQAYDQLISKARAAYAKNRDNAALLSPLTEAYLRTGQQEQAIQMAERLMELDPSNESYKALLQEARSGEVPAAAASAPSTSSSSAELPVDIDDMAGVDYSMEELEEASGEWLGPDVQPQDSKAPEAPDEATAQKDEFIVEHTTEAEVFIKYGLVDKAIEHLEAIVSHYPDECETLIRLKGLYLERGDNSRAASRLVDLARAYRAQGETDKAEEVLREAESLDATVVATGATADGYEEGAAAAESADVSADEFYGFGDKDPGADDTGEAPVLEFEAAQEEAAGRNEGPSPDQLEAEVAPEREVAPAKLHGDTEHGFEINLEGDAERLELREGSDAIAIDFEEGKDAGAAAAGTGEAMELRLEESPSEELDQAADGVEFFDDALKAREGPAAERPEQPVSQPSEEDAAVFDEESDFFHIADAMEQDSHKDSGATPVQEEENLEDLLREMKRGVDEQVDKEDCETHYQLGIAYKEMGLVDEAIAEFQTAAKSEEIFADCCSNLGVCFREKGMAKLAVKWYEKALDSLPEDSPKYIGVLYDLGESYEQQGDTEKACEMFMNVFGLDANYREVSDKVQKLCSD